jgi:CRP-like cAMP-binding protein
MPSEVIRALLEVAPLFAKFTDEDRRDLWNVALEVRFPSGDVLYRPGEDAHKLYVLAEGTVVVFESEEEEKEEEEPLATLTPPASVGEVAFFEHGKHRVLARALTPTHALMIDRPGYDRLLADGSMAAYKLAHAVLTVLADRVRRMDQWIARHAHDTRPLSHDDWRQFRTELYQEWQI